MQTRKLGKTDLDVTLICLGTMTWGEQNTEKEAFEQLDYAVAEGINFIDAAEMYPVPPRAETQALTETYLACKQGQPQRTGNCVESGGTGQRTEVPA